MVIKYSLILVAVFVLFAAAGSSSSAVENESLLVLKERFEVLQSKMDQLVNQLEEEKLLRGHLQSSNAELERKIHQLAIESAKQNKQSETKIDLLLAKNVQQDEEIFQLKNKFNKEAANILIQPKLSIDDEIKTIINHNQADSVSSRLPPSSCRQLSTIGHYLDGIYLVANPDTNKIESVYCDFGSSTLSETLYGSVDIKTKSVHFFVQLDGDFALENTVIPFDSQLL